MIFLFSKGARSLKQAKEQQNTKTSFRPDFGRPDLSHTEQPSRTPLTKSISSESTTATSLSSSSPIHIPWTKRGTSKIASIDIASVGNASDTLVACCMTPTTDHQHHGNSRALHEQAKSYLNHGNYQLALDCFQAILQAQHARFGNMHTSVGAAVHNVAVCHQRLGRDAHAEALFAKAVQIRMTTLGRDHLDVAASLSKLGAARAALGKLDAAFDSLLHAIRIAQLQLGANHKTVAQMKCQLACFYYKANELYAAQATFMDAYDCYRTHVWPSVTASDGDDRNSCMSQMTDMLCNIGSIQNRRKQFDQAIVTFTKVLDLQRGMTMGQDAPCVVSTLDNLAFAYIKTKDYTNALQCYRDMYDAQVLNCCHDGFSPESVETLRKQAFVYEKLDRIPEAIDAAKTVLRRASSATQQQPNHPSGGDAIIIRQTSELLVELLKKERQRKAS
jgi:tetratricopeptide (TPR) repeat protein